MKKYSKEILDEAKIIIELVCGRNPDEVYQEKIQKHKENLAYLRKTYNIS